ncbi:hypothetical protein FQA47_013843 [Oryzias melastigma]|uniref:Uncharacterized protein n=1 Tax=Oryzias melastigma TaxID=30732 RepID=A0A834BXW7_ORYME|nr:hypothetical protein FQA47_013843 [Oryzias melastigma]
MSSKKCRQNRSRQTSSFRHTKRTETADGTPEAADALTSGEDLQMSRPLPSLKLLQKNDFWIDLRNYEALL